jgi:hypothetical protein
LVPPRGATHPRSTECQAEKWSATPRSSPVSLSGQSDTASSIGPAGAKPCHYSSAASLAICDNLPDTDEPSRRGQVDEKSDPPRGQGTHRGVRLDAVQSASSASRCRTMDAGFGQGSATDAAARCSRADTRTSSYRAAPATCRRLSRSFPGWRENVPRGCRLRSHVRSRKTDTRPFCHREARVARRGDPAGLLRRSAPRNDSLNIKRRWYYP